ncbi:hypothetical protein [Gimesia aquarii]|uniref:DUF3299 domain-containing protein n=1 Tax=Gimesia aquarii TaxID=2527964 RepID=A0A517W454_9PLAN|nr:hypothetical protein [Gimesia aquarii]QDU00037.1 hypothetical protein V144x_55500 [Gimesia aquarii]
MQAHLYPTRQTTLFLVFLILSSLPVLGTGCTSSEPTEYRQFSDQIDQKSQDTSPTEIVDSKSSVDSQQTQNAATTPETRSPPEIDKPKETSEEKILAQATSKQTVQKTETKVSEDKTLALVARKPNPKDRALTEQEKKELAALEPREVKLLIKNRTFQKTSPGDALRVSYDDIDLLKVLNMEPVTPNAPELMPQWLKNLDGARIRIRGFMYPPFQQTGNEFFMLARDNQICCFGKNPKIYDLFPVVMRDGVTTDYILNRPFDVVGTFHIKAESIDDELERIYMIDDAIVIDQK